MADESIPTLGDVVVCGEDLARELTLVLAELPAGLGRPEPRPVRLLRTQVVALRSMDAAASGFWARRQTWSLGQTAVVVVPSALRGVDEMVAPIEPLSRRRCTSLVTRLADLLDRHARDQVS